MRTIKKSEISMNVIYHEIWQIRESCLILSRPHQLTNGVVKMLFVPQMALKALECELEMKYLILSKNDCVEATHSLEDLYKLLPENIRIECRKICDGNENFESYLNKYSDAFVDFRYQNDFKGIKSFEPWFLTRLSDVLNSFVIDHKP